MSICVNNYGYFRYETTVSVCCKTCLQIKYFLKVTQKSLETEFQTTVKTLIQVTGEKEAQEEECKKTKALLAALTEEFETSIANLKSLLQKEQNR